MSDPSYLLQVAQRDALLGDSALVALVTAPGVYDQPKPDAEFPFVQIGESQVLENDTEDCGDGSEVFTRTHVWSRDIGLVEVKKIAAEVRRVLKTAPPLSGFNVSVVQYVQTQFLRDPDGQTQHAVVEHRYLITHTA